MNRTLVIYHSVQGNTEQIAKIIAEVQDADLVKINKGQKAHSNAILMVPRIFHQMYSDKYSVVGNSIDVSDYDTIFIGLPCWMYQASTPVKKLVQRLIY